MTPDDSSPEFTRRKFTLPEKFDQRLQRLSSQHYQGNVSLCIRAAIEDHESTLTDNEQLALQHVEQRVKSLEATIQSFTDEVEAGAGGRDQPKTRQNKFAHLTTDGQQNRVTERVYDEFQLSDSGLRIADLVDRVDEQPEHVVRACEQLLDFGYIVEGEQSSRYRIAGLGEDL